MTDITDLNAWPESLPESDAPQPTLSAYLAISDARRAIAWYGVVFGAKLVGQPYEDGGQTTHAGLVIGDSVLMLAEADVATQHTARETGREVVSGLTGDSVSIAVADVDATLARAGELGAEVTRAPGNEPYGRTGAMVDPFGRRWLVQSR